MPIRSYSPDFPYQLFSTFGPIPDTFRVQISVLLCQTPIQFRLGLIPGKVQQLSAYWKKTILWNWYHNWPRSTKHLVVLTGQSPDYANHPWFRSSHDPSLGSATPRGQTVISRGSLFRLFWTIDLRLEIEETAPSPVDSQPGPARAGPGSAHGHGMSK